MNKYLHKIIPLFFILNLTTIWLFSNEIDLQKNAKLFDQMFGADYSKAKASSSKKDGVKYGLELLENAEALQTKPALQIYIKFKAASLFRASSKHRKKARNLLNEVLPELPASEKKIVKIELLALQKQILSKTSRKKKNEYLAEVETFVSFSQMAANESISQNKYPEAIKVLREALRYLKIVDKSSAVQFNKQIKSVQKNSKRFNQINSSLKVIKNKPDDIRSNLILANYYLLEKSNLYKAWPYLKKSGDETLISFFKNIKLCLDDQKLKTADGLSMSSYPLINEHPSMYLKWLTAKELNDPGNIISSQYALAQANKEVQINKIKLIILNTIKLKGKEANISHESFIRLAKDFEVLAAKINEQKNIQKNAAKYMIDQLISNQYIALSKAKIKLAKNTTIDEVVKLRLDMDIGKCHKKITKREIDSFDVDLKTQFLFQQNDLLNNSISVSGGNTYTFDPSSFKRFKKDFEIIINGRPLAQMKKDAIIAKGGYLNVNHTGSIFLKSKKKKWSQNMEVSFDIYNSYENLKRTLNIQILLKPDIVKYKEAFSIYYHLFLHGGWFGVAIEGINGESNRGNKFSKKISPDRAGSQVWKEGKAHIAAVFKNKTLTIYLNGEVVISNSIESISKVKGFPNTPIQIHFSKGGSKSKPIQIDNLYIGAPKKIKKVKKSGQKK